MLKEEGEMPRIHDFVVLPVVPHKLVRGFSSKLRGILRIEDFSLLG